MFAAIFSSPSSSYTWNTKRALSSCLPQSFLPNRLRTPVKQNVLLVHVFSNLFFSIVFIHLEQNVLLVNICCNFFFPIFFVHLEQNVLLVHVYRNLFFPIVFIHLEQNLLLVRVCGNLFLPIVFIHLDQSVLLVHVCRNFFFAIVFVYLNKITNIRKRSLKKHFSKFQFQELTASIALKIFILLFLG
jgi:hypothetical protein